MIRVVGIKFDGNSKVQSFDAKSFALALGDVVIIDADKGLSQGTVAEAVREENELRPMREVIRVATEEDKERIRRNEASKVGALKVAVEKIAKHNLPMKLIDVEFSFDGEKVVFFFTADSRVDFRDLVRDLASYFRMRIELRQIGIRDECKLLGGIAPCGRECCCAAYLSDFAHVTVKMAKTQGLSLNPTKISGLCGRLMCCLEYENDHYLQTSKRMPKLGSDVETPDGRGVAVSVNMLKEIVRVRVPVKDSFEFRDYPVDALKLTKYMTGSGGGESNALEDMSEELPTETEF